MTTITFTPTVTAIETPRTDYAISTKTLTKLMMLSQLVAGATTFFFANNSTAVLAGFVTGALTNSLPRPKNRSEVDVRFSRFAEVLCSLGSTYWAVTAPSHAIPHFLGALYGTAGLYNLTALVANE